MPDYKPSSFCIGSGDVPAKRNPGGVDAGERKERRRKGSIIKNLRSRPTLADIYYLITRFLA
jgi:hypothetical protein